MPTNKNYAASIKRVINQTTVPQLDQAEVTAVPAHEKFVLIRRGGSSRFEQAYLETDISLSPGDHVAIMRPNRGRNWVVLSAYTDNRSGSVPNVPDTSRQLASPDGFQATGGVGCVLVEWRTPPVRPDLSYQLQVAPDPNDLDTVYEYYVRGSCFLDIVRSGLTRAYRARCVDAAWRYSAWTSWDTATATGSVMTGPLSERPETAIGEFFATDTDELYIGDGDLWHVLSGGSSLMGWDPDAIPASPSAYDDEFSDASFDTGLWTEFDPDTIQTVSEAADVLTLSQSSQADTIVTGAYQSIPAGDFTIAVKVRANHATASSGAQMFGLILWDDAATPSNDLEVVGIGSFAGINSGAIKAHFGGYNVYSSSTIVTNTFLDNTWYYLRVRRTGTTYYFDYSSDGFTWSTTSLSPYSVPSHFGVGLVNDSTGQTLEVDFEFFRYRAECDISSDPVYGDTTIISEHGSLNGLGDDDHTQYFNTTRGDARYSQPGHTHTESDITDLDHDATALQGNTVSSSSPSNGDVLTWSAVYSQWEPAAATGTSGGMSISDSLVVDYDSSPMTEGDANASVSGSSYTRISNNIKLHVPFQLTRIQVDIYAAASYYVKIYTGFNNDSYDSVPTGTLLATIGPVASSGAETNVEFTLTTPLDLLPGNYTIVVEESTSTAKQFYLCNDDALHTTFENIGLSGSSSSALPIDLVGYPGVTSIGVSKVTKLTTNVSNPPTDAELDSAIGQPASHEDELYLLDDNDADSNVYLVASNGTSWWYATLTKAT